MKEWMIRHVVRVFSLVAAGAPVAASLVDHGPWKDAAGLAAVILAVGECAQRIENLKTFHAYLTPSPDSQDKSLTN